jgi:putative flippase GtrA
MIKSILQKLINREKKLVLFVIFGGVNTIITLALYYLLLLLGINYLIASSIVYIAGIVIGYIFNSLFVFQTNSIKSPGKFSKYLIVYIISFFINMALMYFFVTGSGFNNFLSQVLVVIILTIWNYFLCKKIVFKNEPVK